MVAGFIVLLFGREIEGGRGVAGVAFILPYEPLSLEISRLSQFIYPLRNIVFTFPLHINLFRG